MENPQRLKLSDVKGAIKHVRTERRRFENPELKYTPHEAALPDPVLFDYFFQLQGEIESEGAMDYRIYAERMWDRFYGECQDGADSHSFEAFQRDLIGGLHSIDMDLIVYPHVRENLAMLIRARKDQVKALTLWSTGDVNATGYQAGKIDKSGIIRNFFNAVKSEIPKEERGAIASKTRYMVDDDKFERLADYVGELRDSGEQNIKLLIIEDSSKNFGKVEEELVRKFGETHGVEVIPVWATYSREGQKEEENAEKSEEAFMSYSQKRSKLNAINSFSDLLGERFNEQFENAHVFVDFDGVIGDNVAMRKEQAKAIFHSLLQAGASLGLDEERVKQKFVVQKTA